MSVLCCIPQHMIRVGVVAMLLLLGLTGCATRSVNSIDRHGASTIDLFSLSVQAQRAYQESRWFDAVRFYQKIVEHVPKDAVAWFRLANTYTQQGAYEHAIHAYEQSLLHDNEQPKAWFNLSTAYLLHAQSAMRQSLARMTNGDPAGDMIQQRMRWLDELVLGRMDSARPSSVSSVPSRQASDKAQAPKLKHP